MAQFKTAFQLLERFNEVSSLQERKRKSSVNIGDPRNAEMECPICFESDTQQIALTCCNQAICKTCFKKLKTEDCTSSCPACRSTIAFDNYDEEGNHIAASNEYKKEQMWEILDILYSEEDMDIHISSFKTKLDDLLNNSLEKMALHQEDALGDSGLGPQWDSARQPSLQQSSVESKVGFGSKLKNRKLQESQRNSKLCKSCQRKVNREWKSLEGKQKLIFRLAWMKHKLQYAFSLPKEASDIVHFKVFKTV
jgi:hypothetical protein